MEQCIEWTIVWEVCNMSQPHQPDIWTSHIEQHTYLLLTDCWWSLQESGKMVKSTRRRRVPGYMPRYLIAPIHQPWSHNGELAWRWWHHSHQGVQHYGQWDQHVEGCAWWWLGGHPLSCTHYTLCGQGCPRTEGQGCCLSVSHLGGHWGEKENFWQLQLKC